LTIQQKKALVWAYWQAMQRGGHADRGASPGGRSVLESLHPDVVWHGFMPLRQLYGPAEIWESFWAPLLRAIPDLARRTYLFIGGQFEGHDWVCGTGDLIGTFAHNWLGIPASGTSVHLRFGEFCRVHDGTIAEIRCLVDLPDLARQAGIDLLPPSYGRDLWIPGPMAGDGVFHEAQDPAESRQTLELVEAMIFGGLNRYDGRNQDSQGLERFWHPHMVWHGPAGIGSAYGLDEFKRNAQGPIVRAFPDRKGVGHQAQIAEGRFAASTGWPSLVGTHQRPYIDWAPTGEKVGWNIMDFWTRDGNLLLEDWVLIDLIGAALESGVDLLARLPEQEGVEH
jgi:ketosteroid isomerase-like protein